MRFSTKIAIFAIVLLPVAFLLGKYLPAGERTRFDTEGARYTAALRAELDRAVDRLERERELNASERASLDRARAGLDAERARLDDARELDSRERERIQGDSATIRELDDILRQAEQALSDR